MCTETEVFDIDNATKNYKKIISRGQGSVIFEKIVKDNKGVSNKKHVPRNRVDSCSIRDYKDEITLSKIHIRAV